MNTNINWHDWNSSSISECEQFLNIGGMQFMALGEVSCIGCDFLSTDTLCCVGGLITHCCGPDRKDNENIIWMRIL